jgi:hypothetical protein
MVTGHFSFDFGGGMNLKKKLEGEICLPNRAILNFQSPDSG